MSLSGTCINPGIRNIQHYLDDFIVIAPPDSRECQEAMVIMDRILCWQLGVPIAEHE